MLTRDQRYSTIAFDQVCKVKKEESNYQKYGAMAHKLPILIHTAGLAQALEFVNARGEEAQKRLLKDLAITVGQKDAKALLAYMRGLELSGYMRLTQQILAALLWYKRFAQSMLGVDASESNNTESSSEVNNASSK